MLTIVKAVEHVQEHRTHVSGTRPVHLRSRLGRRIRPRVPFLPRVAAAPYHHRDHKQHAPYHPGPHTPSQTLDIQPVTEHVSSDDLARPVKDAVERSGPDVELCGIEVVELVGVEPIAGQEHGEEADDPDVGFQYF